MTCSVTAYYIDFEVEYTVNGGVGFYSDPGNDEIEIDKIYIDGDSQDLTEVLASYVIDKIEDKVRDKHIEEREE